MTRTFEREEDALARRLKLGDLMAAYEQSASEIRQAFGLLRSAEERLCEVFTDRIHVEDKYDRVDFHDPEDVLKNVQKQLWRAIVDHLELRRFMSVKAWHTLEEQLSRGKELPPFELEAIRTMAEGFRAQLPDMLEAAIKEVFDWLVPREGSWREQYKTNDRAKVGEKVVVTVLENWSGANWHVSYYSSQQLTALENVFTALDGQGQVTKSHASELENAINTIPKSAPCVGETRYFEFKGFKNRNLHLKFKRPDLVAKFNAIVGGDRLAAGKEAT